MGIVIRHSIRSSIISYIGVALGAFNILWLSPKFLKPEEFGLIRLLQDIPFLFALFVQLGASSVTDRFFHRFKDGGQNRGFLSLLLLYPLIGYSLFVLSFILFNDFWKSLFISNSGLLLDYFIYLLPLTLFMMYTSIMEAYLRANMNINWANFSREILLRIFYSLFVFTYALKLIPFDYLIYLIILGYFISLLSLFFYSKKINLLQLPVRVKLPERLLLKEIGTYLIYLIPGTAGSLMVQKIDTIMLALLGDGKNAPVSSHNSGLENIAIYSLAYFISSVIDIPRKSISQISFPILSVALKEEDLAKVGTLYRKSSITQYLAGIYIFLMIWINIDDIFSFIPNSEIYRQGKYVILFVAISKLFDMATSINGEIIQMSKYYRFNIVAMILLAVLTIVLNTIFIPKYTVVGAAIALAITIFLYNASKTYYIWYTMKLSPFAKDMIPLSFFCIAVITYTLFVPYTPEGFLSSALWTLFRSTVFSLLFYFMVRKLRISEDLNTLIDRSLAYVSEKTGISWLKKYL